MSIAMLKHRRSTSVTVLLRRSSAQLKKKVSYFLTPFWENILASPTAPELERFGEITICHKNMAISKAILPKFFCGCGMTCVTVTTNGWMVCQKRMIGRHNGYRKKEEPWKEENCSFNLAENRFLSLSSAPASSAVLQKCIFD